LVAATSNASPAAGAALPALGATAVVAGPRQPRGGGSLQDIITHTANATTPGLIAPAHRDGLSARRRGAGNASRRNTGRSVDGGTTDA